MRTRSRAGTGRSVSCEVMRVAGAEPARRSLAIRTRAGQVFSAEQCGEARREGGSGQHEIDARFACRLTQRAIDVGIEADDARRPGAGIRLERADELED